MRNLSLQVENFKAIKSADLSLNGITVLSGINSTGKSTLSKLLYYVVKLTLDFDNRVNTHLLGRYDRTMYALNRLLNDFNIELPDDVNLFNEWRVFVRNINSDSDYAKNIVITTLNNVEEAFLTHKVDYSKAELQRVYNALKSRRIILNLSDTDSQLLFGIESIEGIFETVRKELEELYNDVIKETKERPLNLFFQNLNRYFKGNQITFDFAEDDLPIVDYDRRRLNHLYTVDQVFYIDTPMSLQITGNSVRHSGDANSAHWNALRDAINNSQKTELYNSGETLFTDIANIISGEASVERTDLTERYIYHRPEDGLKIELAESATGIKSFSILQMLLSHGLLNEKTLLIIDEPEVHLHPQWIVEYARIIIMLNKHLGVRFMLASHNPDMVSALRYIAEKEETLSRLNYYLAEECENKQYIFKDLGDDINPIFKSFNIAFEKIRKYGVQ